MAWGRTDGGLWRSPKWLAASMSARGLWESAKSWCMDDQNLTDGFVPTRALKMVGGTARQAAELVRVGLWEVVDGGWQFHDFTQWNPDAASIKAARAAESESGAIGNHRRWHIKRGVKVPTCIYCHPETPSGTRSGTQSGSPSPSTNTTTSQVGDKSHLGSDRVRDTPRHEIQPCGKRHDPERGCRACALAAKEAETEALRVKAEKARARNAAEKAARDAETARTLAESNDTTTTEGAAKVRAALTHAKETKA